MSTESESEAQRLARREWFRLRDPSPPGRERAVGADAHGLSDVEQPPNHDGMDMSSLPPMREGALSADEIQDLFADISALATDISLMQRLRSAARASAARVDTAQTLVAARDALLEGRVPRVQIRYRWQNSLWIDTLEANANGYRIVRIAHGAAGP